MDDLKVKYLDDENEEIGISDQNDLDYAYQVTKELSFPFCNYSKLF